MRCVEARIAKIGKVFEYGAGNEVKFGRRIVLEDQTGAIQLAVFDIKPEWNSKIVVS